MKKNRMMRLASGLLILTILTTCIISGTFAKYATGDNAEDSARVAKWGVTTTISGALFGEHYNAFSENDNSNQIAAGYTGSVDSHPESEANTGDNIVAPGTQSEGITISVAGKPEVSGEIAFTVDKTPSKNYSDIWLASGKYGVMVDVTDTVKTADDIDGLYCKRGDEYSEATTYSEGERYYKLRDEVTLNSDNYQTNEEDELEISRFDAENGRYYPIIWTLSNSLYPEEESPGTGEDTTGYSPVLHVCDVEDTIKGIITDNPAFEDSTFKSHTDLGGQVGDITITWQWPFEAFEANNVGEENVVSSVVDGCDTILGKLIAYKETSNNYQVVKFTGDRYTGVTKTTSNGVTYAQANGTNVACLTVGFNVEVTVTQTD